MIKESPKIDVIIIGAGAAGLMAAIEAGKRQRRVLILEHNDSVGKKIRISGGGRCNFTNTDTQSSHYLSHNIHFPKSALARFTPKDFIALVEKYQIPYHEKKLGQLFCDGSAQAIIDMLKKECALYGVTILLKTNVLHIKKTDRFHVETNTTTFDAPSVIISSGGLSIPTLGVSDLAYRTAKHFDIALIPCRPGLVPLTLPAKDLMIYQPLSGISLDVIVSFRKTSFRENILFTHKGLSGPAILQISSYWKSGEPIIVNLVAQHNLTEIFEANHQRHTSLKIFLKDYLPSRFCDMLCDNFFSNKPLKEFSLKELRHIADTLHHWTFMPNGTEGYAKAEVTLGGIDTKELSSKTMESHKVAGLYFIGEAVDVTGHLGGFNFQWAWSSGFAAGQYA